MKAREASKTGDIVYRVDPQKLSVWEYRVNGPKKKAATTYENFQLEKTDQRRFQLSFVDKFPFAFKGWIYFLTEDEAHLYIKTQIGM